MKYNKMSLTKKYYHQVIKPPEADIPLLVISSSC